jgi:hypothetical protein
MATRSKVQRALERLAEIAEDGRRKKSEAAKSRPRDGAGRMKCSPDAAHSEQRVATGGRAVAREASAAEAKVSPATMRRS